MLGNDQVVSTQTAQVKEDTLSHLAQRCAHKERVLGIGISANIQKLAFLSDNPKVYNKRFPSRKFWYLWLSGRYTDLENWHEHNWEWLLEYDMTKSVCSRIHAHSRLWHWTSGGNYPIQEQWQHKQKIVIKAMTSQPVSKWNGIHRSSIITNSRRRQENPYRNQPIIRKTRRIKTIQGLGWSHTFMINYRQEN